MAELPAAVSRRNVEGPSCTPTSRPSAATSAAGRTGAPSAAFSRPGPGCAAPVWRSTTRSWPTSLSNRADVAPGAAASEKRDPRRPCSNGSPIAVARPESGSSAYRRALEPMPTGPSGPSLTATSRSPGASPTGRRGVLSANGSWLEKRTIRPSSSTPRKPSAPCAGAGNSSRTMKASARRYMVLRTANPAGRFALLPKTFSWQRCGTDHAPIRLSGHEHQNPPHHHHRAGPRGRRPRCGTRQPRPPEAG